MDKYPRSKPSKAMSLAVQKATTKSNTDKKQTRKVYTFEEAMKASTAYFNGDELAANVWINKYALKDSAGNIYEQSPDDMHNRLASEIARIEKRYKNPVSKKDIYALLKNFKYIIPQGGPMSGIGNDYQISSLSNCFVIGTHADSYPKGSPVMNSALTSTGIVPFMERYSNSTREVAQDGRRGALMLSVSVKHPDAEDFIDAKMELGKVTGANVSVRITDDFMKSVVGGESVPDCYADLGYKTTSTNPCGEIPLCPYDSCRLLAVNLYSYVEKPFTPEAHFNFDKFKTHVQMAQRMMDDIIDLELEQIDKIIAKIEKDPEPMEIKSVEFNLWKKIKKACEEGRRTGVGITAEGDMLAAMNLKYGSDEGIAFSTEVHKTFALNAYRSSVTMAKERGSFPIYETSREVNNPFVNRIKDADPELYADMEKHGRRNIALLTIAPTGTTSLMAQTTSGIEPVFMVAYKHGHQ